MRIDALRLRAPSRRDLPWIDALLRRSYRDRRRGHSYPRCDGVDELLTELRLYNLPLQQCLRVVEHGSKATGVFGFLFDPREQQSGTMIERADRGVAYGIGPLLGSRPGAALLDRVLAKMEVTGRRRFASLRLCLIADGGSVERRLAQRGWSIAQRYIEMKRPLRRLVDRADAAARRVRRVRRADDPRVAAIARLLSQAFRWRDHPVGRLREYLADGYAVACVEQQGEVAGAVVWINLKDADFARLEYVALSDRHRGRGLGKTLVQAALADMAAQGRLTAYLSVDPANRAGQALYRGQGFRRSLEAVVFEKRFDA
jgi:ribosomal-protein-alanine N-acetyltransferase